MTFDRSGVELDEYGTDEASSQKLRRKTGVTTGREEYRVLLITYQQGLSKTEPILLSMEYKWLLIRNY